MRHAILAWILNALSFIATAYFLPGFKVSGFGAALIASVAVGIANWIVWPILMFLTLPINILTFGLFTFVVNGIVIKICAGFVPGFEVKTWGAAIFGSILVTLFATLFRWFIGFQQ